MAKGYFPNCSVEDFVITKVRNTVSWAYFISDLKGEEIVGIFVKKELRRIYQKEFRVENVTNRKGDQLYVKWKG